MKHSNALRYLALALLVCLFGCQTPYDHRSRQNTRDFSLFGGLAGAGLGAALSKGNSNTGENALLGAALGALTGAAVGSHMDDVEARNQALFEQHLGRQLAGAVTKDDVISMSQAGLGDEVIRTHIARHGIARPLTTQDLIKLSQQGVSDGVLQAMQAPPIPRIPPPSQVPVIVEEHYYGGPHFLPAWSPHYGHHRPCYPHQRPGFSWGLSFGN